MRKMDIAQKVDVANEATKAAPPLLVAGSAHILGYSLNEWVAIATIAYIALQAAYLLWKWWRLAHDRKASDDDAD